MGMAGKGAGGGKKRRRRRLGGGRGEREKFTGEWVDATRPSNRCLDYSAWRIGIRVNVYCVRVHVCVLVFFRLCYPPSRPRNIVYLYFPPTALCLSPIALHPSFPSSFFFLFRWKSLLRFFFCCLVPERNRSRSPGALAWIACVNARPMVNELAVISILRASRAAPPRRCRRRCTAGGIPEGDVLARMLGRDYLPYLPTYPRLCE